MYFAKLDENNIFIQVIVADQSFIDAQSGMWVVTDIDGASPKNYAGIGHVYDEERDAFIAPKPYPSWILNESTCIYEAPIAYPGDGNYHWDEDSTSWIPFE